MAVEGTIVYGAWNGANPIGSVTLVGEDGLNYIVGNTGFTIFVNKPWRVGQVQNESIISEYDETTFNTEFLARQLEASGHFSISRSLIPVRGTPYFFVSGVYNPEPDEQKWGLLLRKIVDENTVSTVGSILMNTGVNEGPTPGGVCFGTGILDSQPGFVFVIMEGGYVDAGSASTWAIRLPISETDITDLSPEAIENFGVRLSTHGSQHPLSWHSLMGQAGERIDSIGNKCVVVEGNTKDFAVVRYRGLADSNGPGIFIADVDLDDFLGEHGDHFAGAYEGDYISDISSSFDGFPWADIGNHLDNSPSGDDHDDYTILSVLPGGQWVWLRSDSANTTQVFGRVYERDGETITFVTTFQFTHNAANIATFVNAVEAWRPPGSDNIIVGIRDDFRWIIGEFNGLPSPVFTGLSGGAGMQFDAFGCLLTARAFALEVRDLNSVLELGPFRFVEQKESDETSMITTLILGLTEVDTGLVVEVDMMLIVGEVDMETLVDVLGDEVEIDMGEGVDNSDDFTLELLGNDDGSTYPGAPIEFKPEILSEIDDRGSIKQYSPLGYSYIYHRVRLKATEVDEKFAVKFVDISGQLTGRLF